MGENPTQADGADNTDNTGKDDGPMIQEGPPPDYDNLPQGPMDPMVDDSATGDIVADTPDAAASFDADDADLKNIPRPPYSLEAEQSVLGAVMLDNRVLDRVADVLVVDDFYAGGHRVIFEAMLTLSERGEPIDPLVLKEYLDNNGELDSMGGAPYLARLVGTVPTTANALSYAKVVHDKAVRRALGAEAAAIAELVYQGELALDDILDESEQRIFGVAESKEQRRSDYSDMRTVMKTVFERIETLMNNQEGVTGVATGFVDLDNMLTGLQPSDLVIVAGRPSMGKTALAMNIAANAAMDHGASVGVFSLEMSKEQLVMRLLASTARINAQALRIGNVKDEDFNRLTSSASLISKTPIFVDDTPALSVTALRSKARRLRREKGIDLILVDYLQLMRATGAENRVQEITQISQGLKAIAKELNIPVVALSQLSRSVESRENKRPILSDLRESGSIEQDADVVMFIFREEYYKPNDPSLEGKAELIVAKQRNGPTGTVTLTFQHMYTRFENYASNSYDSMV